MFMERICKECEIIFNGGPRAYYCPFCRLERQRQQSKDFKIRKTKGDYRKLGSVDKCEQCGSDYIVKSGIQKFCPKCQKPHAIEHDRIRSIEYYHENKTDINHIRNLQRKIGFKICSWCEKEFETTTRTTTCSEECKRLNINRLYRKRWKSNKK